MKEPMDWIEADLEELITTQTKESIDLEYKRSGALLNDDKHKNEINTDISKDVSAFANSAGGIIIYGICENGHIPTKIEGIDLTKFSKERLELVISSNIQRKIDGIKINQVDLAKSDPGKVAYVVCIPQSNRAPHQAKDKKFYKRYNFSSIAMEEYEIRDVSRRNESPDLKLIFNVTLDASFIQVFPIISNESPTPAEYVVINIYIDSRLCLSNFPPDIKKQDDVALNMSDGGKKLFICLSMNHSIPGGMPIFQGINFQLLTMPLAIEIPNKGDYIIHWKLMSPKMPLKSDQVFLKWDGIQPVITTVQS